MQKRRLTQISQCRINKGTLLGNNNDLIATNVNIAMNILSKYTLMTC